MKKLWVPRGCHVIGEESMKDKYLDGRRPFSGVTFEAMTKEQTQILGMCVLKEEQVGNIDVIDDGPEMPVGCRIILKRVQVFELPIKFTECSLMATMAFCSCAGHCVILLIDALTMYEGQTITVGMLADIYPNGFYSDESVRTYVDDYIKPRKIKWSELY